jgi:hypothetical protein
VVKKGVGVFTWSVIDLGAVANLPEPGAILDRFGQLLAQSAKGAVRERRSDGDQDQWWRVDVLDGQGRQTGVVSARFHLEGAMLHQVRAVTLPGFEFEPVAQAFLESFTVR